MNNSDVMRRLKIAARYALEVFAALMSLAGIGTLIDFASTDWSWALKFPVIVLGAAFYSILFVSSWFGLLDLERDRKRARL